METDLSVKTFARFRENVEATWKGCPVVIKNPEIMFLSNAINEEAGELAGQVKKLERDDAGVLTPLRQLAILKEMGDALYYYDRLAAQMGTTLEHIVALNRDKLQDRADRGVLHGDGDNR